MKLILSYLVMDGVESARYVWSSRGRQVNFTAPDKCRVLSWKDGKIIIVEATAPEQK